ncbi:unnamed protein product [Hapterophycus canaliculatus]
MKKETAMTAGAAIDSVGVRSCFRGCGVAVGITRMPCGGRTGMRQLAVQSLFASCEAPCEKQAAAWPKAFVCAENVWVLERCVLPDIVGVAEDFDPSSLMKIRSKREADMETLYAAGLLQGGEKAKVLP